MDTNENKDLGDKKWKDLQHENAAKELNEGFSGNNISDNYNPSDEKIENRLRTEIEQDKTGDKQQTERARFTDDNASHVASSHSEPTDNSAIKNKKSVENRDRNSDIASNRYPESHPDNQQNRGNIELDD